MITFGYSYFGIELNQISEMMRFLSAINMAMFVTFFILYFMDEEKLKIEIELITNENTNSYDNGLLTRKDS